MQKRENVKKSNISKEHLNSIKLLTFDLSGGGRAV